LKAVLFDLGGNLVDYYQRHEFSNILVEAINGVMDLLDQKGLLREAQETIWDKVKGENHESPDHRVRPLEGRLSRIFGVDEPTILTEMCGRFMEPIFSRRRIFGDALQTLRTIRSRGLMTAIVSNTPWGSPGSLWREEVRLSGLSEWFDAVAFCRDVGWRKPAKPIFEHALKLLRTPPEECLFVGDDPRWDIAGPMAVGMTPILIDRGGFDRYPGAESIRDLGELTRLLDAAPDGI
jgi:putative hydrolase of the HAD superfamily